MSFDKVSIRPLPIVTPPVVAGAGRLLTGAGELVPIVNDAPVRFVAYVDFLPDVPHFRGNHYHATKVETLYIIRGRLRGRYRDLDTGEEYEATLGAGDLVTVAPRCAHVYIPSEYSQAVEVADGPYDPEDTFPHFL